MILAKKTQKIEQNLKNVAFRNVQNVNNGQNIEVQKNIFKKLDFFHDKYGLKGYLHHGFS